MSLIDQSLHLSTIDTQLICPDIPLHDKNWFATGGSARYFATPLNALQFQAVLQYAQTHQLALFVLGEGANVLISDNGFDGLVIQPHLKDITWDHTTVTAGAGVSMHELIDQSLAHNLIGLEEFSGIPGTIGGSVYINLHYYNFLLEQFIISARVIHKHTGVIETVDRAWFQFGYNHSRLHVEPYYMIDATFQLKQATDLEIAYARGRRTEIIRHRNTRYPTKNTCGSFFRNFYPEEVTLTIDGKKMIYVAYYLDKLGIKGHLRVGDAQVSYQHANMLVNLGKATSADLIACALTMQSMTQEAFGIIPQPECELIGFDPYPLLSTED